jgi:predicted MFS family arabinose efflux permease
VSDWYGRRTVLLPALGVALVAAVVFLVWKSLAGLLVGRVLTGVSHGAAAATATAFITDLGGAGEAATRGLRCWSASPRQTQLDAVGVVEEVI